MSNLFYTNTIERAREIAQNITDINICTRLILQDEPFWNDSENLDGEEYSSENSVQLLLYSNIGEETIIIAVINRYDSVKGTNVDAESLLPIYAKETTIYDTNRRHEVVYRQLIKKHNVLDVKKRGRYGASWYLKTDKGVIRISDHCKRNFSDHYLYLENHFVNRKSELEFFYKNFIIEEILKFPEVSGIASSKTCHSLIMKDGTIKNGQHKLIYILSQLMSEYYQYDNILFNKLEMIDFLVDAEKGVTEANIIIKAIKKEPLNKDEKKTLEVC